MNTRPTSDRLRETLFNVLGARVQGARFTDLYAGSGAVGIEALSRGAAHSLFVEQAAPALAALRKNLTTLGIDDQASVAAQTVAKALAKMREKPFDVVFLDPPYDAAAEYNLILTFLAEQRDVLLAPEAVVVAEHAKRHPLSERYGVLDRTRVLQQGDAALSFFAVRHTGPEAAQA